VIAAARRTPSFGILVATEVSGEVPLMKSITLPELALIAVTRAALGAGIGLLLGPRLGDDQRRAVGWTLLALGVLSTVPLAAEILGRNDHARDQRQDDWQEIADEPYAAGGGW